jgi:hypothetical protein
MANKTDRMVSYLPSTFKKQPRGQTLHVVMDAYGRELQDAENSLAAVMQSHWVDYADRLETQIDDLARIAALYGLAPRQDEDVEEFREHLKRYVRTYLEGTVTVQGILRIAAQALGLHIADEYEDLDSWWTRADGDAVTITELNGRDAATQLFGARSAFSRGLAARAAQVRGTTDLSLKVDARENNMLRLEVDGAGPFEIDIAAGAEDPAAVPGDLIATNINAAVGADVARFDGRYLTITSSQRSPASYVEVHDILNDAADAVLGLPPRTYNGRDETPARVRGLVDLSGVLDLSESRYLRLLIDGTRLAEIDVAGPDEKNTLLTQIVEKLNAVLGPDVVTHDGRFLTLTSPTTGLGSSIVFQQAAAQQALLRLFGPVVKTHVGRDTLSAQVVGRRDLSAGVDLSELSRIALRVDGAAEVEIDCTGLIPENTQLPEIVAAINEAVNMRLATHDGRHVILTSPSAGLASEIAFLTPDEADATELIFGIRPRIFRGRAATAGSVVGTPDLSNNVDLRANYLLRVALDGRPPVTIDLRTHADEIEAARLREVADAIDAVLGADVAATDGQHLILVSATEGSGSSVELIPLADTRGERFVSRAIITDEAAEKLFGFHRQTATGTGELNARVRGTLDVHRGLDLREKRYLRLIIDDHDAVDIDVAGERPRATLIDEVVTKINEALNLTPKVASHTGRRLLLTSHITGRASRIAFGAPRNADALPLLLNVEPGDYRGQNAEQVRFVGTVDLSAGIDLSGADHVRLGVDGAEPIEIAVAESAPDPSNVNLNQIMLAINLALGRNLATHDGRYLALTSPTVGAGSQLSFAVPEGPDATEAIFGIPAPREYHGRDASAAEIVGNVELGDGVDRVFLQTMRYLRLGVDGSAPQDIDCLPASIAPEASNFVSLREIAAAIDDALGLNVAHDEERDGDHVLVLRSPTTGQGSRLVLEPHSSGDARELLFGSVPDETTGVDPLPAVITGEADLLAPADLSQRSVLRLAVDGGAPVDVDVAGFAPGATLLEEVVAAINAAFPGAPGLASGTPERRLQLTSPTTGPESRLELLPLRTIDLIEYPPFKTVASNQVVRHNQAWRVDNRGAAAGMAEARITAPLGAAGATLLNETIGWQVRLLTTIAPGETARIWAAGERLRAEISTPAGARRRVSGRQMLVGPLGAQAWVPFEGSWQLSGDGGPPPALQLNNPQANYIVWLHARQAIVPGQAVSVAVSDADLPPADLDAVEADGQKVSLPGRIQAGTAESPGYRLVDTEGDVLAVLRDGAGLELGDYRDRVVVVTGTIHAEEEAPLLIVQQIDTLFVVTLHYHPPEGEAITERYQGVTIGQDPGATNALVRQIQERPSALVRAESLPKISVLSLPLGRTYWRYLDCYAPRFNFAYFDQASFPSEICYERGVFDASRFENTPPEPVAAVFTGVDDPPDAEVQIQFETVRYQPGAFRVHLPADLPEVFGARFNQSRFGQGLQNPELYEQVVTEPASDPKHVEKVFDHSPLIEAKIVPRVPLGFEPLAIPFPDRNPRYLALGDRRSHAQLYLAEEGIAGFLLIEARDPGDYGNQIGLTVRSSGPAMYDFAIIYEGAPFENARETVLGKPLAALTEQSLQPGPAGILQAKAAGVEATVTREHTPEVKDVTDMTVV